jgi:Ran GTPase-activating protein (RanGAP) involved in mRNA processing and transport
MHGKVSTSMANLLEAFTERGVSVLALQLCLLAAAGVTAFFRGFKEAGITIPYPQRDVHLRQVVAPE